MAVAVLKTEWERKRAQMNIIVQEREMIEFKCKSYYLSSLFSGAY